jgi:hypothetical protein
MACSFQGCSRQTGEGETLLLPSSPAATGFPTLVGEVSTPRRGVHLSHLGAPALLPSIHHILLGLVPAFHQRPRFTRPSRTATRFLEARVVSAHRHHPPPHENV